jgi:S-adenosylmethionine uptake transporter
MGQKPHTVPFLAALAGIALFSVMDALMKRASIASGAYSAMLVRSVFGVLVMAPLWRFRRGKWPKAPAMRLHALRGAVAALMATTFFWALVRLPLAEAIAISFIAPLIALYLAGAWLGEKVSRGAIVASVLGFSGVAVIASARLGAQQYDADAMWGIISVLVSAVAYAVNLVLQRKQALLASPDEVALFQFGFSGLYLALGAPWFFAMPGQAVLLDIGVAALFASVSLMLLSWAYGRAEAQVLVSIEYSAFVWAAIMGWLWFDEALSPATVAGTALIVAGCWIGTRQPPSSQPA